MSQPAPRPSVPEDASAFAERNRFGRVGRIPTPTPFPVGDVNAYLLFPPEGEEELTLIDTGVRTEEAFDALRGALEAFGAPLEKIARILVTHAHADHFGQAARLRALSGAAVYASAVEAELMRTSFSPTAQRDPRALAFFRAWGVPEALLEGSEGTGRLALSIQEPVEVAGTLEDGDRIELPGRSLEVLSTPGHCEGHLVFYDRERRTLFSGDHLLPEISPVPLLHIPKAEGEARRPSLVRFLRSLEKVEALEIDVAFPAHGDVIRDPRAVIAGYRRHHERRKRRVAGLLAERPRTPFEVAAELFPRRYASQLFLVLSEAIGHLDVLVEEGAAEWEAGADGVWRVRSAAA